MSKVSTSKSRICNRTVFITDNVWKKGKINDKVIVYLGSLLNGHTKLDLLYYV